MIRIVTASPEHLNIVLKMRRECCADVFGRPESSFEGAFTGASEEYFINGEQTTVLAFSGEKAVGCATICYINVLPTPDHPTGKRAHIMNVYTNPDYRRQGIAKRMLQELLRDAKRRGVTYVSLDATEDGAALYRSLGFEKSGENMGLNL